MSLFGLRIYMSALKRPVLISRILTSGEWSLGWKSGPRSDSATILMGKIGTKISSLQFSVFFIYQRAVLD